MNNFFITQFSIGYLGPALLALIIAISISHRMWQGRQWKTDQASLALYFLGAGIYCLLNFTGFSWYDPGAQVIWQAQAFSPFIVLFLVMFSYHYPTAHHRREFRIVMVVGSLLTLFAALEYWLGARRVPVRLYGQIYGSENYSLAVPLINASFYLWTITVFLRRLVHFERSGKNRAPLYRMLLRPVSPQGRASRAFAVLLLLDLVHSMLVFSVMSFVSMSVSLATLIFSLLILLIMTCYILVYLHSAYRSIPYIYRLSGIPIVASLVIVTIAAYTVLHFHSGAWDEINRARVSLVKIDRDRVENPGSPAPAFIGRVDKSGITVLERGDENIPALIRELTWEHVPSGLQMAAGQGSRPLADMGDGGRRFIQAAGRNFFLYGRVSDSSLYCFAFPYRDYLAYMHRSGQVVLVFIVSFTVLLMIIIPLFYYFGFIVPLRNIISRGEAAGTTHGVYDNELHHLDALLQGRQEAAERERGGRDMGELSRAIRERLDIVVAYIAENYRDEISREGLAAMIDLDPDYMSRLFRIYRGMKLGDYINSLRIEEACQLLRESDATIIDISLLVGFESLRTFNRAFSRFTGLSPSEYRRKKST